MKSFIVNLFSGKFLPRGSTQTPLEPFIIPAQKLLNDYLLRLKRNSSYPVPPELLFPQLVRQLQETLGFRHVSMVLSHEQDLEGYYGSGNLSKEVLEDPLVISTLRELFSGKTQGPLFYVLKTKEGELAIASYPLYYDKKIIGALSFFRSPHLGSSVAIQELQSSFSYVVGLMLQDILSASTINSVKKKLQESQQDLATIHRISMIINSRTPLEEIMEQVIREAATCLTPAANQGGIFKVNPRKKGFTLVAQFGLQQERVSQTFFNFDEAFTLYQAYLDHRTISYHDLEKDHIKDAVTELFQPRAFIISPLIIQEKAVGVMFLGDTQVPHKFSLGETSRVVTISHQLSTAIYLESLQKLSKGKNNAGRGIKRS